MKVYILSVDDGDNFGGAHPIKVYSDKNKANAYLNKLENTISACNYEFRVTEMEVDGKPDSHLVEEVEE